MPGFDLVTEWIKVTDQAQAKKVSQRLQWQGYGWCVSKGSGVSVRASAASRS